MSTELKDANEVAWDNGDLGESLEHAIVAPSDFDNKLDDALGLQMISIRLNKKLIDDLKLIAKNEGIGYQPLIRRVLTRFVHHEFRSMAYSSQINSEQDCNDLEPISAVG